MIEYWFPTPILFNDCNEEEQRRILAESKTVWPNLYFGNPSSWRDSVKTSFGHGNPIEGMPTLKDKLHQTILEFTSITKFEIGEFIIESWFNSYEKGDFQHWHNHGRNDVSAVYYLQAPEKSSKIWFKNPAIGSEYTNFLGQNAVSHREVSFDAKPGRLIVFPSYLEHKVDMNESVEPRVSIAINLRFK